MTTEIHDATAMSVESSVAAESDEQLMAAFAQGSGDSFSELFLRYKQPLFGFFRRRVTARDHAEELTQETFLAVLHGASRYQQTASFRTYLYSVGLNVLRAYRRKAAFRAVFHGPAPDNEGPPTQGNVDAALLLREAVRKLERVDREVLLLREFEKLSYAEIAEVLKLPVNTVRSRLFRARTALRDLLVAPATTPARTITPHEERA